MESCRVRGVVLSALVGTVLSVAAGGPNALGAVTFFVNNPTANSLDFLAECSAKAFSVDGSLEFSTHPDGTVISDWYSPTLGVRIDVDAGGVARVETGPGSFVGNITDPDGIGEGVMPEPARYMITGTGAPTFVDFVFAAPVAGVGLRTADMFQWGPTLPSASIEAFASDGTSLGVADAVNQSFEFDFVYFMGVTDDASRISRVRFTNNGIAGDTIYITQVLIATKAGCLCPADYDCNGFVTGDDFDAYVLDFVAGNDPADFNGDGFVTGDDYDAYVVAFEAGC